MLSHPIYSKIFMVKWSGLQINFVTTFLVNWVTQRGFKKSLNVQIIAVYPARERRESVPNWVLEVGWGPKSECLSLVEEEHCTLVHREIVIPMFLRNTILNCFKLVKPYQPKLLPKCNTNKTKYLGLRLFGISMHWE